MNASRGSYHRFSGALRRSVIAALAALMLTYVPVFAQLTCVGPATGIPANATPPDWWVTPATAVYSQDLDDPRWVGAGSINFGDGTANIVEFRALQDATNLYLSWRIHHVIVGTSDNTLLYFGFPQPVGDPLILKVNLKQNTGCSGAPPSCPLADTTGAVADFSAFTRNSAAPIGQGAPVANPAWFVGTASTLRVWAQADGPTKPESNSWGVQVRIPRSAVQFSASTFKLWFEVKNATPANPTFEMAWPSGAVVTEDAGFNEIYPDPSGWQTFQPSTGPTDPACATAGVSLTADQIGTLFVYPNTNFPDPERISLNNPNTFFARPKNNLGRDINAGEIVARFRIANWGSSPNGWESGVNDNVLWSDIPGGGAVANALTILNGTIAHGNPNRNDNEFDWTLSAADRAPFDNGTRLLHQCMLVELTSPTNVRFVNNSIRRNMNFAVTSRFSDEAEINIKSLSPIAPDGRDVYIWVETLNMPSVAKQGGPPPLLRTLIPDRQAPVEGPHFGVMVPPAPTPVEGKSIPVPSFSQLQQMLAAGVVTTSLVEEVVPTYIVHVYHDTGRRSHQGGVDRPILSPQGAFGYFVSHEGPLYGWENRLVGKGFALEKLADNFYRIKKVPNDGSVRVVASITALEKAPTCLSNIGLGGSVLLLPGMLVFGLLVYRRKRHV